MVLPRDARCLSPGLLLLCTAGSCQQDKRAWHPTHLRPQAVFACQVHHSPLTACFAGRLASVIAYAPLQAGDTDAATYKQT